MGDDPRPLPSNIVRCHRCGMYYEWENWPERPVCPECDSVALPEPWGSCLHRRTTGLREDDSIECLDCGVVFCADG